MDNIIIIGLGPFGSHMARELKKEDCNVLAIEKNEVRANKATEFLRDIQIADATDEVFIRSIGVSNYDMCVVAIDDDFQAALEITVLLKDYGAKFILARADSEVHKKLLLRNGADKVICADQEMAERLAFTYAYDNVFDYIRLTPEYGIYEIETPHSWCGHTLAEAMIRNKYNVSILATKRDDVISPLPPADYIMNKEDRLVVLCHEKDMRALI